MKTGAERARGGGEGGVYCFLYLRDAAYGAWGLAGLLQVAMAQHTWIEHGWKRHGHRQWLHMRAAVCVAPNPNPRASSTTAREQQPDNDTRGTVGSSLIERRQIIATASCLLHSRERAGGVVRVVGSPPVTHAQRPSMQR